MFSGPKQFGNTLLYYILQYIGGLTLKEVATHNCFQYYRAFVEACLPFMQQNALSMALHKVSSSVEFVPRLFLL
jgi:hypothetical protein